VSTQPIGIPRSGGPNPAFAPNPPRRSWLGRNWKWLLATFFLGLVVFAFGIFAIILGVMRDSTVAKNSVERARSSDPVVERLGTPISEGWLVSGSVNVSSGAGDADLTVPIAGPKGKGTVYAVAHMTAGTWTYDKLQVGFEGSAERVNLLAMTEAATTPPDNAPAQPAPEPASQAAPSDPSVALAATPTQPDPTPSPAPAAPGSVIASAQYANDPSIRCDLLEVKRLSGSILIARWRLVNTGTKGVNYDFSWDDIYYLDPAGNKKYDYLKIDGRRILDVWWGTLQPGEQRVNWAKFPAPPPSSKRISLNVPKFTPFEDVPVGEQ